jgi:hypothetical protein
MKIGLMAYEIWFRESSVGFFFVSRLRKPNGLEH